MSMQPELRSAFIPTTELLKTLWLTDSDESIRPKKPWNTLVQESSDLLLRAPGCQLNCIYCNQQWMDRNAEGERDSGILSPGDAGITINLRINFGKRTIKEVSIDAVIDLLREYPLYSPEGAILIGNYTDPGLNWKESCDLASRIVSEFSHSGPILFITKMPVNEVALLQLQQLQSQGGKVAVIVTYSGMPKAIEPASARRRISAVQALSNGGIPTILSMRPMIPGINGTPESIEQVLRDCGFAAHAIIFGGLFVYDETADLFEEAGYPLPPEYASHNYTVAKKSDDAIAAIIYETAKKIGIKAPVYEHTNCAVSYLMGAHYNHQQWNKS